MNQQKPPILKNIGTETEREKVNEGEQAITQKQHTFIIPPTSLKPSKFI